MYLAIYIFLRLFSFFFHPGDFLNTFVAALILFSTIYFLLKKDERGWYIVAAEIILGGTGSFLAVSEISLRTLLLIFSALIFIWGKITDKKVRETIKSNKIFCIIISALYIWLGFSALNGYLSGHAVSEIKSDLIPYLFLFYYFPLIELLRSDKFKKITFDLLVAAIFGNLIFVLFTFIGYSSGWLHLQDSYYHWFRDIANGKITAFDFNFYRIVLNEHLLLSPLLIYFIWRLIKQTRKIDIFLALSLIVILSVNFTRAYMLALSIGLLFLFSRNQWKKWLAYSVATLAIFFISFTLIHTGASRGQSLGWEFFGIRLQSIAMPQIEESSLSRLTLLPAILDKIKVHLFLGNGMGDTVAVDIPIMHLGDEGSFYHLTTPQFDWGYLEMIDELGIIGFIIWGVLIYWVLKNGQPVAPVIALLIINITSPALFHVMGIIWITFTITQTKSSYASPELS